MIDNFQKNVTLTAGAKDGSGAGNEIGNEASRSGIEMQSINFKSNYFLTNKFDLKF